MKIFKPSTWGLYKVIIDIRNYRDFVKTIKKEKLNPNSKFNKWKLNTSYFYSIYFTYDLDDTEANLPDKIKNLRIIESLAPLHIYLDEELGFAECLVPEISQFYNDRNEPTLTYLVAYRFSFNKLTLGWILRWTLFIAALITAASIWGKDIFNLISSL